jgi:2-methylcitrate dehydratase PrpD
MAEVSSTKSFLNWMYSTGFDDIPQDVRNMAVLALYDGIGCNLACSLLPTAHRMVDFVNQTGGAPDCTMMGFPMRTSLVNAAMVNGTLGHGDEMDAHDGDGRGTHILAATMAAALTSGQLVGATGLEVLRGVVLGYELSKRIVRVANRVERETGKSFGPVDAGNTMGATAASGITLGLPPDRLEVALGRRPTCPATSRLTPGKPST